ncbi:MAG TPA: TIR domain-containing protein [Pyrinomonadaceae bacterium]
MIKKAYKFDIFPNYRHEDSKLARRLVKDLSTAGFSIWFDEEQISRRIRNHKRLAKLLGDALANSQIVLQLFIYEYGSPEFQGGLPADRWKAWFMREVFLADAIGPMPLVAYSSTVLKQSYDEEFSDLVNSLKDELKSSRSQKRRYAPLEK